MEIVIASDQNRDNLFAEVHFNGQPWAEVIFDAEKGAYLVTIFSAEGDMWPSFDLSEVRRELLKARDALVARGYPSLPV